jgi:hypothetical protein
LTRLSADERAKKNPIDWKFLSEEYKNAWLKQIPPEHRTDQKVLDEIKRVKPQFRQLLTLSSRLATAEKEIEKAVVDEWKKFQSTLAKGLRKALKVYIEDETAKVVLSKVEQIYKNWHSEEVTQTAKSMAEAFSKEINYDTLKQIDEARNLPNKDVEQFLIEKLSQAPQKDEEFQFVFQQLSARANADVIRRTGDKLMDLTPEKIAEGIEITTESILRLRFQFAMVKPLEKPTEEIIRNEANRISRLVAGDTELMQKAYEKVLNQMIHPNSKIQAQLFKKYYNIELTSQEIYDRMQSLGAVWKVDLQAFEKDFRGQLSKEEYTELFEAAVTSKSRYTTALKSVMKDRKIDRFKSLLQKVVDKENPHYADYLAMFVDGLSKENVISEGIHTHLLSEIEEGHPEWVVPYLHTVMRSELFDKLEATSLPQLDISSTTSSINEFLDDLMEGKLITSEERNYFYPVNVPEDSTPNLLIKEFSKRVNDLPDLPLGFQERLEGYLNPNFGQIASDKRFISETLKRNTDSLVLKQKEEIDKYLEEWEIGKIFEHLHPESVEKTTRARLTDEDWAEGFWEDYFSREHTAFQHYQIGKREQDIPPDPYKNVYSSDLIKRALSYLSPEDNKNLAKSAQDEVLAKSAQHEGQLGGKKAQSSSSEPPPTDMKVSFPDAAHFVLRENPLKPSKTNTVQQFPQLADDRFKNSPFRYLDKHTMNEWNDSVIYIRKEISRIYPELELRNAHGRQIEAKLKSMGNYYQVLGKIVEKINEEFRFDKAVERYNLIPGERETPVHTISPGAPSLQEKLLKIEEVDMQ